MKTDEFCFIPWQGPDSARQTAVAMRLGKPVVLTAQTFGLNVEHLLQGETLNYAEQARAAQFKVTQAREAFVVSRGLVRAVLGHFGDMFASLVPINAEPNQKPALGPAFSWQVDFNISHSSHWIACAFVNSGKVGVDIELGSQTVIADPVSLARMVCSPAELTYLISVPENHKRCVFLDIWRRKEALLKAAGLGLSGDPQAVTVVSSFGAPEPWVYYLGARWRICVLENEDIPPVAIAFCASICN